MSRPELMTNVVAIVAHDCKYGPVGYLLDLAWTSCRATAPQ